MTHLFLKYPCDQLATFLARHGTFCEQFGYVIGQAGIEQLLKRPGELRALEIALISGRGKLRTGLYFV